VTDPMRTNNYLIIISLLIVLTATESGCSFRESKTASGKQQQEKYLNVFSDSLLSKKLEDISKSVCKVSCYAIYRTYLFDENSKMLRRDLSDELLFARARASISSNEAVSGTATVIYSDSNHIALLTCAHIVNFPDTVVSYYEESDLESGKYIQSISVKEKQQVFVRGMPDGGKMEILISDRISDISILGKIYENPGKTLPVFAFNLGKSTQLKWGSYLYLIGYPLGQLMITGGMGSKPVVPADEFVIDALFNEGFSGGIVLAINSTTHSPELVGIGRSVSARSEYILKPEKENYEISYNPKTAYRGETYVKLRRDINYGITYVVPSEKIREFYLKNRAFLLENGINLDSFFSR